MLQWMGGSRRKVTASRNSTHKRQKQYFEQRKRQQRQIPGLECFADGKQASNDPCENNRSLDILSLRNVSSVAQKHDNRDVIARYNEDDDEVAAAADNDDDFTHAHKNIEVNQAGRNEERTTSSHYPEMRYSKKVNVDDGHCSNFDHLRMSTARQISVIDLLGDGEPNSDTDEKSVHTQEAHVAFSVEGLGKMDAETPVQSPEISGRFSLKGCPSPRKDRKSKHLNCNFDDLYFQDFMTQDTDFSPKSCPIKYAHSSIDAVNIASHPNHKFSYLGNYSPFNWNGSNLNDVYGNDELFCTSPGNDWFNSNGNLFKNNLDDIEQYESFPKNWIDHRNTGYANTYSSKTHWNKDINLENWNVQDKRFSSKQVEMWHMTESPFPSQKYTINNDLPDFKISNTRNSTSGIDVYAKDAINCFMREDTRESLSRLSEESCSSTAVKGDATKQSTSKNT